MHPHLKLLIELQRADVRLHELREELAAFPKRLAELEGRVAGARAEWTRAKDALTASLKDRKKYELDVEQWKERVRKYKDQVYEVKTNEAYKALQHEIQTGEAEIAQAEDRLLERMVAGEEYERQVKAAEAACKEVEAAAQVERARIQAEQQETRRQAESLEAERQQLLAAIPEDLLDLYQRIARKHGGVALAEVRDETCTMCRVRVRPHMYQELRREESQEIFHCESCTRILYYVEEPVTPSPAQPVGQSRES